MSQSPTPEKPNAVGNTSMYLGIASSALVFGIALCAWTGIGQRWIQLAGTPLFVCGGASAFIGFLAAVLGAAGLFGKDRSHTTAIVGLVLVYLVRACSSVFFVQFQADNHCNFLSPTPVSFSARLLDLSNLIGRR